MVYDRKGTNEELGEGDITGRLMLKKGKGNYSVDDCVNLPRAGPECSIHNKSDNPGFWKRLYGRFKSYFIPVAVITGAATIFGYQFLTLNNERVTESHLKEPKPGITSELTRDNCVHSEAKALFENLKLSQDLLSNPNYELGDKQVNDF